MKKLLRFFVLINVVLLGAACSSDDSKGDVQKELALFSDADEDGIYQGSKVEFTVFAEKDGDVVTVETGVSFYVNGVEVKNPYTFEEVGEFKVVAKKNGYKESNTLLIKVIEGYAENKLTLALENNEAELFAYEIFRLTIKDRNGTTVSNAILYENGEPSSVTSVNGVFEVMEGEERTYTYKAVYEGIESNELKVMVKKSPEPNAFVFNGKTHDVGRSVIILKGIVVDDTRTVYEASWQLEAYDRAGNVGIVQFFTPATRINAEQYSYEKPTATNTTPFAMGVMKNGNILGVTTMGMTSVFASVPTDGGYVGKYKAKASNIGGLPFSLSFSGYTEFIDGMRGMNGIDVTIAKQEQVMLKNDFIKVTTTTFQVLGN